MTIHSDNVFPSSGPINRRNFLRNSSLAVVGAALPAMIARSSFAGSIAARALTNRTNEKSVVFLYLAGGPSHLDMYDMKPAAPSNIRGEFPPINTVVPGIRVCEHLPLHAKIADKFAIVNGVETIDTHSSAAIAGNAENQIDLRTMSAVRFETPSLPHGDWDTHGRVLGRELSIFAELREKLPAYDALVYDLISDLYASGQDQDLLIVVCGEFGRTPWINKYGGRDHWAPCSSVLFAGGGLKMGQTIGDTGPIGERERSRTRPYTAQNVLAMIHRHLSTRAPQSSDADLIAELV
jgi:uncharacterized protein (DUF1501 family)